MALPHEMGIPLDAIQIANPSARYLPTRFDRDITAETQRPLGHLSFLELSLMHSTEPLGGRLVSPDEVGAVFAENRHAVVTPAQVLLRGGTSSVIQEVSENRARPENVPVGILGIFDPSIHDKFYKWFVYDGGQFGIEGTPLNERGEISHVELSLRRGGGSESRMKPSDFSQLTLIKRYESIFSDIHLHRGRIRMTIAGSAQ